MNDEEVIANFIRIKRTETAVKVYVRQIYWNGPHRPIAVWTLASELDSNSNDVDIDRVVHTILSDRRYFRVCVECKKRKPVGWMHDDRICQSCAEKNHGVVY